jgi:hypothetical protein
MLEAPPRRWHPACQNRRARACGGRSSTMNRRDRIELAELLEEMDRLIHEYITASTVERREMLEAEIRVTKVQLNKAAASFRD